MQPRACERASVLSCGLRASKGESYGAGACLQSLRVYVGPVRGTQNALATGGSIDRKERKKKKKMEEELPNPGFLFCPSCHLDLHPPSLIGQLKPVCREQVCKCLLGHVRRKTTGSHACPPWRASSALYTWTSCMLYIHTRTIINHPAGTSAIILLLFIIITIPLAFSRSSQHPLSPFIANHIQHRTAIQQRPSATTTTTTTTTTPHSCILDEGSSVASTYSMQI